MSEIISTPTTSVNEEKIVNITENAISELKRIMTEKNISEGHGLRMGVKGGGCSGFSYILGFDSKNEEDNEYDVNGLKVYMHPSHQMYLAGIQLDFHDGLNARGFTFINPNATKTCGCGSSFSA